MMAHEFLRTLAKASNARRCIMITSETSGNPALAGTSPAQFESFVSVRYAGTLDGGPSKYPSMRAAVRQVRRLGQFDIGFLDPFHTYEGSMAALKAFTRCTAQRGWLIVHDCFPPYELAGPDVHDGSWCGATYAAFRDFALKSDRAWFVIDSDYGLGVLGPEKSGQLIRSEVPPDLAAMWARSDVVAKRELYREHGAQLMRRVAPEAADGLVADLMRGESVTLGRQTAGTV